MFDCDNISALARELGIWRKHLYDWREAYLANGVDAFRSQGRPRQDRRTVDAPDGLEPVAGCCRDELFVARSRIAQLERKLGHQAEEAEIFKQSLLRIEAARPPRHRRSPRPSAPRSRRSPNATPNRSVSGSSSKTPRSPPTADSAPASASPTSNGSTPAAPGSKRTALSPPKSRAPSPASPKATRPGAPWRNPATAP